MRHHRLIPPLEFIEEGLFGCADQADPDAPDGSPAEALAALALPALIAEAVARRVAAAPLAAPSAPAPGEVWWLALDAGADRPVALALLRVAQPEVCGWLVGSEVAYAGDDDWVMQDDDVHGALDPRLGMVHLWNPVCIPAARLDGLAAAMRSASFDGLRTLAQRRAGAAGTEPAPGRVGLSQRAGVSFVCGTPLGQPQHDPRHAYRALYRRLAALLGHAGAASEGQAER